MCGLWLFHWPHSNSKGGWQSCCTAALHPHAQHGWRAQRGWVGMTGGPGVGEATLLRRVRWDLETGALLPLPVQRAWLVWGVPRGLFYTWQRWFVVRSPSHPEQSSPPTPKAAPHSQSIWPLLMIADEFPAVLMSPAAEGVTGLICLQWRCSDKKSGWFVRFSDGLSIWIVAQQVVLVGALCGKIRLQPAKQALPSSSRGKGDSSFSSNA